MVGAVLDDPRLPHLLYTAWVVPPSVVAAWIDKKTQMGQLEIFAGPVASDTWGPLLQDAQVIHFVDNDSATSCLVKGYSPKEDSCKLVGDYWLRAAARRMNVYIDRVESKSNIADGPSRWDFKLLEQLGAVFHQPKTDVLLSPPSSNPWFWFGADQQRGDEVLAKDTSGRTAESLFGQRGDGTLPGKLYQ